MDTASGATEDRDTASGATEDRDTASGATEDRDTASGATEDRDTASGATEDRDTASGATEDRDTAASRPAKVSYHHGQLRGALQMAAVELIGERGAGGFSLREVARRAGVSHAAPKHHFGDSRGLLTSVATEAFEVLFDTTRQAAESTEDPVERLAAIGRAYVELGRASPGHCAVVFRHDLIDPENARYQELGDKAYGVLESAVADVAAAINPQLDQRRAAQVCWAMVQGLVVLYPNMAAMAESRGDDPLPDVGSLAEEMCALMVEGLGNAR